MIIAINVDDLLVASKNKRQVKKLEEHLRDQFKITNRGQIKHCFRMEFSVKPGEISVMQSAYIRDILERFGMSDCKSVSIPIDSGARLKTCNDE